MKQDKNFLDNLDGNWGNTLTDVYKNNSMYPVYIDDDIDLTVYFGLNQKPNYESVDDTLYKEEYISYDKKYVINMYVALEKFGHDTYFSFLITVKDMNTGENISELQYQIDKRTGRVLSLYEEHSVQIKHNIIKTFIDNAENKIDSLELPDYIYKITLDAVLERIPDIPEN